MAHANLPISFGGDALLTAAYVLIRVLRKSVPTTPYELWFGKKPSLDNLHPWGSAGYVHNPTYKHKKLGPRATKMVFIRYLAQSKGYVMYGEHPNGGMIEINSHNINFLEDEFPTIGEVRKDVELFELQQNIQPSFSEGENMNFNKLTENGMHPLLEGNEGDLSTQENEIHP